jgi:GT2 family glycosyltransferase
MLEQFNKYSSDNNYGVIHAEENELGIGSWDLFLIKDWVIKQCGLFDENFYPAYVEDIDYLMRIVNNDVKCKSLNIPYLHGEESYSSTGSQTWRSDLSLKDKIYHSMWVNENDYMVKKWGERWRQVSPFKTPFNNPNFDSKYITYDLDFVRSKHLGF